MRRPATDRLRALVLLVEHTAMTWPTLAQVEAAGIVELTGWVRFLPSPDDAHRPILVRILERHAALKAADPVAAVAASKSVGWG